MPYLAWAGEETLLNKCFSSAATSSTDLTGVSASFLVEDWSGGTTLPQVEPNTVRVYFSSTLGEVCAEGDVVSLFPGIARVELDVADPANVLGLSTDNGSPDPVLKHQFLAGWMTLNTPTLTEMGSTSFARSAQAEAARELGDPTGNGQFNAGGGSGYLDVTVTGSIPMNGPWAGLVGQASVTLPNEWPLLAHALATDTNPADTSPWTMWETSGDNTGLEGHVTPAPPCALEPVQFIGLPTVPAGQDNVDDCTGGGADGPFSRVFGDLSGSGTSIGPFDPVDPGDTLLPQGTLTARDAPMPAARIDLSIAPNSGGATDTSGVGFLAPADKAKTYSRDFLGSETNSTPHNEYAPFYDAYIPATSRPGDASSGIDGGMANNFNGFLVDGEYHFWDFAATEGLNLGSATSCLRYSPSADPQADSPGAHPADYYATPSGVTAASVYTDQHGEAQVQWYPGMGFYFDSLIATGAAVPNADGGCDLQSLYKVPGSLGSASITATAIYPFKPVDYPPLTSAPVTKTVTSLWSKTLAYFPKGPGAANASSRIVVAHAQNIDGTPFAGEAVCFTGDAEGITWFDGTVGGINLSGTSPAPDPKGPTLGRTCVTTDGNGNAAVEVLESNPVMVNVIADFANEGILREITVDYTMSGSTGGTPPPPPTGGAPAPPASGTTPAPSTSSTPPAQSTSSTPPSTGSGGTSSPAGSPSSVAGANSSPPASGTAAPTAAVLDTQAGAKAKPKVTSLRSHIRLVRLMTPLRAKHYVLIRVNSNAHFVTVHMRLVRRGHGARWVSYRVRTNRVVKIAVASTISAIKGVTLR